MQSHWEHYPQNHRLQLKNLRKRLFGTCHTGARYRAPQRSLKSKRAPPFDANWTSMWEVSGEQWVQSGGCFRWHPSKHFDWELYFTAATDLKLRHHELQLQHPVTSQTAMHVGTPNSNLQSLRNLFKMSPQIYRLRRKYIGVQPVLFSSWIPKYHGLHLQVLQQRKHWCASREQHVLGPMHTCDCESSSFLSTIQRPGWLVDSLQSVQMRAENF